MLPITKHNLEDFSLPQESAVEKFIKAPIRRYLYPAYNFLTHQWLSRKYQDSVLRPDLWMWGNRGNDYARNRRRVNRILNLSGKNILIVGCGSGRDVSSWLPYRPACLVGVDYLDYGKAWSKFQRYGEDHYPATKLDFFQADITELSRFSDASFDVVGSDAVFEHVKDIGSVLKELHRVLRPGGILYAAYGPLWHCCGGDHISGFDGISTGYNHLLLEPCEYERYINEARRKVNFDDLYARYDLFSYLRPVEYLSAFANADFERLFCGVLIEPKAVRCLKEYPDMRARLLKENTEIDLITDGMIVIYKRKI